MAARLTRNSVSDEEDSDDDGWWHIERTIQQVSTPLQLLYQHKRSDLEHIRNRISEV